MSNVIMAVRSRKQIFTSEEGHIVGQERDSQVHSNAVASADVRKVVQGPAKCGSTVGNDNQRRHLRQRDADCRW